MTLAEKLAEYVLDVISYEKLPDKVVREVKRRIIDSFAVMMGAYRATPPSIARRVALLSKSDEYGATVFGTEWRAPVDHASFANGCLVRYLDFNDTYLSKEALHPSDTIPAMIAVGEAERADGRKVIEGIVASYEIACRLADASSIRARGWDHVTYIAIAAAAGAGKIMGLTREKLTHAINLATVANVAMRQTRAGELSMWKGCAAANAARNGVFAALLAKHGMTGPAPIFEGEMGFWKQVSGEFTIDRLGGVEDEPYKVLETSIKYYPVEYHAMSAVDAALKIREKLGGFNVDEVESISIKTFTVCYNIIVKDPEKWDPKTRETADHSLPYIVAAALLDGRVWLETFEEKRILDPEIRRVISKMRIEIDPDHDREYPRGIPNTIRVTLKDGRSIEERVTYPKGHFLNPVSDEELESKFHALGERLVSRDKREEALKALWSFEQIEDLTYLMKLFTVEKL